MYKSLLIVLLCTSAFAGALDDVNIAITVDKTYTYCYL